jgi:two-component system nitrogen regulation sensor histidine kinase NtrY
VAVFAGLTVNVGLEAGFRTGCAAWWQLAAAAEAYEDEHRRDLAEDAQALAELSD